MTDSLPRVLLTDDDPTVLKALQRFFEKSGWSSHCALDGMAGLEAVRQEHFNLVVTDLQMPQVDGFEFIKKLRSMDPDQAVIVLSVGCSVDQAVSLLREGVSDVIYKPVDFDALRRAVGRISADLEEKEQRLGWAEHVTHWNMEYCFETHELIGNKLPIIVVESLLKAGKLDLSTKLKLDLVMSEVLTNGLEHGNLELKSAWREESNAQGQDRYSTEKSKRLTDEKYKNRKIWITFEYGNGILQITVRNVGPGFSPPDLSKIKTNPNATLFCHGRGIALIKELMDSVEYSSDGRCLKMSKNLFERKLGS